jgi:hypothetical protein
MTSRRSNRIQGNPAKLASDAENSAKPAPQIPIGRSKPRFGLGVNDGPVDDFIELVENWRDEAGNPLVVAAPPEAASSDSRPQELLDQIAGDFSAGQMRQLGAILLKLADALDDGWHPEQVRSTYHWMSRAGQIERRALRLAKVALRLRAAAHRRTRYLSPEWFGEPAWEMLLELFIQFAGGARVSTKSLVMASGLADTTGLRVIDRLEQAGLIERFPSRMDKRVTLVSLTREGVVAVGSILMDAES